MPHGVSTREDTLPPECLLPDMHWRYLFNSDFVGISLKSLYEHAETRESVQEEEGEAKEQIFYNYSKNA